MISAITTALHRLALLQPEERAPRFHIGLTTGDTLWLNAFVDDRRFFHVKASDIVSLREEAQMYEQAWQTFSEFMPRPLGYCVEDGWDIFVTEGVVHRPVFPRALLRADGGRKTAHAICSFFETSRQRQPRDQRSAHGALLGNLESRFKRSPFAPLLAHWCSGHGLRELEAIGSVLQHGDFVSNNIAFARSRLVVFDWEDYGKISLPGLDLCTLIVSSLEVDEADALIRDEAPILKPVCHILNLEPAQFRRLVPLYLLSFLYLKEGYATEVRQRIAGFLERMGPVLGGLAA